MYKTPNAALARLTVDEFKNAEKTPFIIVLDNVRSLNNIGSVFRTADAFLLRGICLCGITAKPPHRDIEKTALGATETIYWEYYDNTVDAVKKLKQLGYKILAIEQTSKSVLLNEFVPEKDEKYAFIFGHEVTGVSDEVLELCDNWVEIPQFGTKHSLNISVSVGVVVWDIYIKFKRTLLS